jgi:hypothetical protein
MADVITGTTTGFVNNLPDNTLLAVQSVKDAVKDARYDINSTAGANSQDLSRQVDAIDDTITAQLVTLSRDTQDTRAQLTAVGYQVRDGFAAAAKDSEINALRTQVELAKQSTYLSDKIDAGNAATRELIQRLRDDDLNRALVERNTELVAALDDGRRWRGRWDDGQYQALMSQLSQFQSQLTTSKQDMINFGLMAGVGQSSTNNQVR